MANQNFSDGQNLSFRDLNGISEKIQKDLLDRFFYEFMDREEVIFFKNSHLDICRAPAGALQIS